MAPVWEATEALTLAFGQAFAGAEMPTAAGAATGTDVPELAEQAPFVTVTLRLTAPEAGALKVTEGVPSPETIVPPVALQLYVAPATGVTLAVALPPGQTLAGAAIVALGCASIVTAADALPVQLFEFVTDTVSETFPAEAALKAMAFVPCPEVIEPLVSVQK